MQRISFFAAANYAINTVAHLQKAIEGQSTQQGLVIVAVASLVEMAIASDKCDKAYRCDKKYAWAVVAGAISTVLTSLMLLALAKAPGMAAKVVKPFSIFLVAWWAAGAGVNTSANAPFSSTCADANGYFASWIAFFTSLYYCGQVLGFGGTDALSSYESL